MRKLFPVFFVVVVALVPVSVGFAGPGYTVLYNFSAQTDDGTMPWGDLLSKDGELYGMTSAGGVSDAGVIFSYQFPPPPWITDYNGNGVSDIAIFR